MKRWYWRHRYARQYQEIVEYAASSLRWGVSTTTMERFTHYRLRDAIKGVKL
jgi:hypothetical protein